MSKIWKVRFMESGTQSSQIRIDSRGYHSGKEDYMFKLTEMYYVIVISRQVIREMLGVLQFS